MSETTEATPTPKPACERVRGRLERLLDEGLAPLEAARDRGHLEACAACAAEAGRWDDVLTRVGGAFAPDAHELEAALRGLEDRLAAARAPRLALLRGRGAAMLTAAAAVLALVGLQAVAPELSALDGVVVGSEDLTGDLEPALPRWDALVDGVLGTGAETVR